MLIVCNFTSGRGYQNIAEILSYLEIDEHCRLELKIVIYLKVTLKTIRKQAEILFLTVLKKVNTCIRKVSTTSKNKVLHIKAVFNPGNTSRILQKNSN